MPRPAKAHYYNADSIGTQRGSFLTRGSIKALYCPAPLVGRLGVGLNCFTGVWRPVRRLGLRHAHRTGRQTPVNPANASEPSTKNPHPSMRARTCQPCRNSWRRPKRRVRTIAGDALNVRGNAVGKLRNEKGLVNHSAAHDAGLSSGMVYKPQSDPGKFKACSSACSKPWHFYLAVTLGN